MVTLLAHPQGSAVPGSTFLAPAPHSSPVGSWGGAGPVMGTSDVVVLALLASPLSWLQRRPAIKRVL